MALTPCRTTVNLAGFQDENGRVVSLPHGSVALVDLDEDWAKVYEARGLLVRLSAAGASGETPDADASGDVEAEGSALTNNGSETTEDPLAAPLEAVAAELGDDASSLPVS